MNIRGFWGSWGERERIPKRLPHRGRLRSKFKVNIWPKPAGMLKGYFLTQRRLAAFCSNSSYFIHAASSIFLVLSSFLLFFILILSFENQREVSVRFWLDKCSYICGQLYVYGIDELNKRRRERGIERTKNNMKTVRIQCMYMCQNVISM